MDENLIADNWFQMWWRAWLRRQAGIATPADLVNEKLGWTMSYELMRRIEGWK
ncbi:hypothetical protein MHM84_03680 [Halomonas sp. McH1-25]|uniref:hypothetical protein n=1 Tax=unclassified Halomonas TaxID=2609666 RepID=UPI001EF6FE1B|nr:MULTISPECIES: hypothetical protein [unclassified Halomonas]MCG7598873.1 hypothetical protein [Halomonas sp. McH1-25]MCP1340836.1 hypothetical protein [Halomonas sp. FL8]MCP1361281.1 hypothetical protein [Halomonas sp. BBD45]MCP1363692.1 hypothetical protein [Halomonas sp. BBD48]